MAVGVKLRSVTTEIGTGEFFNAFFSSVSGLLEPSGWGTRFPTIANKLYAGEVNPEDATAALRELSTIQLELAKYNPDSVIWDIDDRSKRPPWGDDISPDISSMADYFVTSTGRDLMETLQEIFEEQAKNGGTVKVVVI